MSAMLIIPVIVAAWLAAVVNVVLLNLSCWFLAVPLAATIVVAIWVVCMVKRESKEL